MEESRITERMVEFNELIHAKFEDLKKLEDAMHAEKLPEEKGKNTYTNSALATLGDALLKFVLLDLLYRDDAKATAQKLTDDKKELENNHVMHDLLEKEGWINYAYNDKHFYNDENIPDHEKVSFNKHTMYLEAIMGAKYLDVGYDKAKEWIIGVVYPLLKKYSK